MTIRSFFLKNLALTLPVGMLVCALLSGPSLAQTASSLPAPDYKALKKSLEETIQSESTDLQKLKGRMQQLPHTKQAVLSEINAYKVQISAHGNLLTMQSTNLKYLESARSDNHVAFENVQLRIKTFKQDSAATREELGQIGGRIQINKDQLESLKALNRDGGDTTGVVADLKTLIGVLRAKQDLLNDIQENDTSLLQQFEAIRDMLENLASDFDETIELRKRQFLLSRTNSPTAIFNKKDLMGAIEKSRARLRQLSKKETWLKELRTDWKSGQSFLMSLIVIYCILQFLLMRLKSFLRKYSHEDDANPNRYQCLAVNMSVQTLYLFGLTGFAFVYSSIGGLYNNIPLIKTIILALTVILFTKWGYLFFDLWLNECAWLKNGQARLLRGLVRFIRYFSLIYLFIAWLAESDILLLQMARLVLEAFLVAWLIIFWNAFKKERYPAETSGYKIVPLLSFMSYGIVAAGVVLEFTGYSGLAALWYSSWGISAIVLLWSSLIFFALREWRLILKTKIIENEDDHPKPALLFHWAALQVGWIAWLISTSIFLITAWGGKKVILMNVFKAATREVPLGSIRFSLMNLVNALLILILTQALARFWRYFLKEKILSGSGMNTGLQNSITMISVYSLWTFGILLSLHVFGFGATSLAVGFGALGIGLGFGLQAIFNNFISGIILLIERPIMVGDDIEINETWATVKKINVRSTVVQTYDNATLIIPNSEFISQQVKNWSFKDKRLRVKIDVGVAYGSDIELVRKTLLEIAQSTAKVFKNPPPDVIFRDFGDSALIFRLRAWTDIDNMFKVETAIRFDIDRLFKEKNIVIAFPQRDVHLFYQDSRGQGSEGSGETEMSS